MPTIDPYAGTPEAFTENMWKEFAANWRTGGESVFNKRSGEASLTGHVPSTVIKAAMRFFLGYEQVRPVTQEDPGTEKFTPKVKLCRKNPIRHPYYENLWCTGVGEHEFKPISPYVPGVGRALKVPTKAVPVKTAPALGNRTGYNKCKLTLRFAPLPYDVLEDDDAGAANLSANAAEWLRNVSVDTEPRCESFEVEAPFYYTEGTGCPAPYTNPKSTKVSSRRAQILVKPDVIFRWFDVPHDWIHTPGTFIPTNILAALGTVNSGFYANKFLGFPIGTLLLVGAKITKYPWTLRPDQLLPGASTESKFLYEVELMCSYFDPLKGFTGNPPLEITAFRGHNCHPWPGNDVGAAAAALGVAPDPNALRWFFATNTGSVGGSPLLRYTPFEEIFNSPQNVTIVRAAAP